MVQTNAKDSYTFWQENVEHGVGEPAVLIEVYTDCISLTQEDRYIMLNYDSLPELLKLLKQIKTKKEAKASFS